MFSVKKIDRGVNKVFLLVHVGITYPPKCSRIDKYIAINNGYINTGLYNDSGRSSLCSTLKS